MLLVAACLFSPFTCGQNVRKLRVLVAPGVTESKPQDWHNSLTVSSGKLTLHCPKCSPIQTVTVGKADVASLRYGENAYHHWAWGTGVGVLLVGTFVAAPVGLAIGLMPHHQHFFSVDMTDGKALGIQADKGDYRKIAGMLENFAGKPIEVSAKEAHLLAGFNTQIVANESK